MPVTTDTLRDTRRVNIIFAVSSAVLIASTFWLIWVDYARDWRGHQDDYMQAQASLAELTYLTTQQESFQKKLQEARTRVEESSKDVDRQHNRVYAELLDRLMDRQEQLYGLELLFKQKDALIVVTRSDVEKAAALDGSESEAARRAFERLQKDEAELAATRSRKEQVEDEIRGVRDQIKSIEQAYRAAQRQLADLQKKVDEAKDRRDRYGSELNRAVFNMPLFDFSAPKGTPGRHEIKQVVARDVKSKLNFLEGYKVDRCTTCHVVIDDKSYTQENLVAQFEAAIPALQEALAKSGEPNAPMVALPEPPVVFGLTNEQLRGQVAGHWQRVDRKNRGEYFARLQDQVNAYLQYVGMPAIELGQPLQAHPDLDLFLTPDSPHPVSRLGCTVCHEGNGSETDFVFAAHTPKSHHEEEVWTHKYYDRNLGVPTMTWSTLEHFWDFPMIPPQYSEASCTKCHTQLYDIARYEGKPYAQKLIQGQKLFTQVGCINCHRVENIDHLRQVGTDLTHVASKLSEGFMHNWIFNPREFRPSTWMPHFFMQENNGPGSENTWDANPVLRTQTEVQAITHYLRTVSRPWSPEQPPVGSQGDVVNGQKLFSRVGCLGCHSNMAEYGEKWIVEDIAHGMHSKQPKGDEEEFTREARKQFRKMDLNSQVRYAMDHFTEESRGQAKQESDREELLASTQRRDPDPLKLYVPPVFTRFAPELSGIGSKVSREWLYSWLREPRHYSGYTKMPSLRLTEQEALDLAAYLMTMKLPGYDPGPFEMTGQTVAELDRRLDDLLTGQNSAATTEAIKSDQDGRLSQRLVSLLSKHSDTAVAKDREQHYGRLISTMDLTARKMLFFGSKMITHYGCYACHKIEGFESAVRPGTELTGWGEKNIHQLDFAFFSHVYHHTLGESEAFKHLYPPQRTDLAGWSGSGNPEIDVVHTHAGFARHKLLNPRLWDRDKIKRPYEKLRMPNFYFTDQETESLVTYLLSRRPARVADSLKIKYEDHEAGPIARGRHLTAELNCVGCHKIEDNVATLHQFITASNLSDEQEEDDWGAEEEEEGEESGAEGVDGGPAAQLARLGKVYGGEFETVNGPPWLRGQGAKVQPAWGHQFLLNIEMLRPWLKVRMPSFQLTSEEASVLVDYFAALSRKESHGLQKQLGPIYKHIAGAEDAQTVRGEWAEDAGLGKTAARLAEYGIENEVLLVRDLDFSSKSPDQVRDVHRKVLSNAEFFTHLFDVQYPFEPQDYAPLDPTGFARGERLFQELKCLACHVLGDPGVPGANQAPSAPNLALTYKRLRYEWFHQWLQEPGKIQPKTKMPQWFAGGDSAYAAYAPELKDPFEKEYSADGETQMRLLMNYVWQAGLANYTAVDPARLPQQAEGQPAAQRAPQIQTQSSVSSATPGAASLIAASSPNAIVLSGAITNAASVGPRPAQIVEEGPDAGKIAGRVIWTGAKPQPQAFPVSAAFRESCSSGASTRVLDRLRVDGSTGGVADCVVYLAGDVGNMPTYVQEAQTSSLTISKCEFQPRVILIERGSSIRVENTDAVPHNVRGRMDRTLLWSKNLPKDEPAVDFRLDKLGIVEVRSGNGFDWMESHVWVVEHAGYTLTNERGEFVFEGIPPGEYTLHVWHPGVGVDTSEIQDAPGSPTLNFEPPLVVGGMVTVKPGGQTQIVVQMQ